MRKLTSFEIDTNKFGKMITSMNIEGTGEGNTKYQFTLELKRITFRCDKDFVGICNDFDGCQTGYAIVLKKADTVVEAVYVTECFESEAFTLLGAYAGSVYMYNTLSDIYIKDCTNIHL
jgi:hypothetical protein